MIDVLEFYYIVVLMGLVMGWVFKHIASGCNPFFAYQVGFVFTFIAGVVVAAAYYLGIPFFEKLVGREFAPLGVGLLLLGVTLFMPGRLKKKKGCERE